MPSQIKNQPAGFQNATRYAPSVDGILLVVKNNKRIITPASCHYKTLEKLISSSLPLT